jgi:RNA polymerase sigma-70 factor (ECF subfamily)
MSGVTPLHVAVRPPGGGPDPETIEARRGRDLELARRCVAGERAAQLALFREQVDRVHRVLYRVLGGGPDLEDVAQDAFLAVFRSLPAFRGDSLLATWIDRITVRAAIGYLERRRRSPATTPASATDDDRVVDLAPRPDVRLADHQVARRLYDALARLDPRQRVAFVLHVIEERSMAEVAAVMGATRVATKTRVWRARRELERRAARDPVLAALFATGGPS